MKIYGMKKAFGVKEIIKIITEKTLKDKIFSVSAEKKQGLESLFQGIETKLYKQIIKENIILDVSETEKIKWLYQNQLVKSSELRESDMKLELIWDGKERQKFNEIFAGTVL